MEPGSLSAAMMPSVVSATGRPTFSSAPRPPRKGLNFQFCGALVNYDMPWNPMKVEQRIGRIDRLGQKHSEIRIFNLHYQDTVEADIYQVLSERINLFEGVVGHLQPILAKMSGTITRAVLEGSGGGCRRALRKSPS